MTGWQLIVLGTIGGMAVYYLYRIAVSLHTLSVRATEIRDFFARPEEERYQRWLRSGEALAAFHEKYMRSAPEDSPPED